MFSYEGGVAIALILWIFSVVNLLVTLNSRLERNLNRIGQRISWSTQAPTLLSKEDLERSAISKIFRFLMIYGFALVSTLLSWIYVLMAVAQFIYRKSKDAGAPARVREFRWKLRNVEMPVDELIKELMKASELDLSNFGEFRERLKSDLIDRGIGIEK